MMQCLCDNALCWVSPIVFRGASRNQLEESDVPALPGEFRIHAVAAKVESALALELSCAKSSARRPSLTRMIGRLWVTPLVLTLVCGAVNGLLCAAARPLLLKELILNAGDRPQAVRLVAALAFELLLEGITTTMMRHQFADRFGAAFVSTLAHLIFCKAMRLPPSAQRSPHALLGNDLPRVYDMVKQLAWIGSATMGLIVGVIILVLTIGTSAVVGASVLALILSLNAILARFVKAAERGALGFAEQRLALVSRIINGIRAIKLSAWEDDFLSQVAGLRMQECMYLRRYRILHIVSIQLGRSSPIVAYCASFIFLGLQGRLTPADVFAAVTVFQAFRVSLIMIPASLVYWAQVQESLRRVVDFLLQPEAEYPARMIHDGQTAVNIEDGVFSWQVAGAVDSADSQHAPFQVQISRLSIPIGKSVGIVGRVGSGKTSLLSAVLGDLTTVSGKLALSSHLKIAYVPQRAFIVAGTIKYNILMGRELDEQRLAAAISGAALERDLDLMPAGLETEIGERGVTLSGGQQQRVAIARALYTESPALLIFDDPLAAVDSEVAAHIIQSVLGRLSDRCSVLMALNQLPLLNLFDELLVLDSGAIVQEGAPRQLVERPGHLRAMFEDAQQGEATVEQTLAKPAVTSGTNHKSNGSGLLVSVENRSKGAIKSSVFLQYVRSMGVRRFALSVFLVFSAVGCLAVADRWLAWWTAAFDEQNSTERSRYAAVYAVITAGYVIFAVLGSVNLSFASVHASKSLHQECMTRLLHAPVQFFEETPSGRILSRMSADLSTVDVNLPQFLDHGLQFIAALLQLSVTIVIAVPAMIIVLGLAFCIYAFGLFAVERSCRELKRLANNAQSPVLSLLNEAFQGRLLLRVTGADKSMQNRFSEAVDTLQAFNYCAGSTVQWGLMMNYIVSTLISSATALALTLGFGSALDQATLGLTLSYALQIPYFLLHSCFVYFTFRSSLASLERLLECKSSGVPQEPAWHMPADTKLPQRWPLAELRFKDVQLCYREGLPPALKNVNCSIQAGERVGVVGRTGAGKSSLVVCLFRLRDVTNGVVSMDGIDIKDIGLRTLRQHMAVIPQEALLLDGTVRDNIDPFHRHAEAELQSSLEKVGFPPELLHRAIGAGGRALSHGQHQLIALARALLRQSSIVVLDEPTSSVDAATDVRIQETLRNEMKGCTLFTIAHRLGTVIDSDKVLVMASGEVVEFGPPDELCSNVDGVFAGMVRAAGLMQSTAAKSHPAKALTSEGPPQFTEFAL